MNIWGGISGEEYLGMLVLLFSLAVGLSLQVGVGMGGGGREGVWKFKCIILQNVINA